jgi:hypothetical protein
MRISRIKIRMPHRDQPPPEIEKGPFSEVPDVMDYNDPEDKVNKNMLYAHTK